MRAAFSKAEIESEIASRFSTAFKSREKRPAETISTGIPEADYLTGGLPRGAITEIFGPASSGRTSFMLSALAHATRHDEICALIDTHDVFDPETAVAADVDLDRLLWIRCAANLEHAFKATDLLLQGGGFGLVLLDIGDVAGKDARRIISSWWYRFRRVVENTPITFVVIGQEPAVRSCATLTLNMKRLSDLWSSASDFLVKSVSWSFPRTYPSTISSYPSSTLLLLRGAQFGLERQKPVSLRERSHQFIAQTFRLN
jgi:recombination protein RecA